MKHDETYFIHVYFHANSTPGFTYVTSTCALMLINVQLKLHTPFYAN